MIELSRLEDVLTEHPQLPRASKVAVELRAPADAGIFPGGGFTAEDLNDYVSSRTMRRARG